MKTIAFGLGFCFRCFQKGLFSALAHSWVLQLASFCRNLKQDSELGWEFLLKHKLYYVWCYHLFSNYQKKVSTTSIGHFLFIVRAQYIHSTQYFILGCLKEVDKFNITHLNVGS